ncbi:MAG: restriction endonuclease subunit M [Oscillospiraceae bacterium]|nr:restriction endonuclease subunit M [Oscillospiraceae bacterium]
MAKRPIDISEEQLLEQDSSLLDLLLADKTTGTNIIWASSDYEEYGDAYRHDRPITPELITGDKSDVIQPRIQKSKDSQTSRTRDKAEVFTPSWVCNAQNNLVDQAWFGRKVIFNTESGTTWKATKYSVEFPKKLGKTWEDYVKCPRMEITCGEAPYLVSRYDTVTGQPISLRQRIGLLDRKLRVVHENVKDNEQWFLWVKEAYKSVYGYEYQGDNLLLARENLLLTFMDWVWHREKRNPTSEELREIAEIITWNIFQMDGLKYVVPESCHDEVAGQDSLFGAQMHPCPGCEKNDWRNHNGKYCRIMDWDSGEVIPFTKLLEGERK